MSIKDIKKVQKGYDLKELLKTRKKEIENNLDLEHIQLSKINYLLEEKNMESQITFKELPEGIAYYREGEIKNYSELESFVLATGEECFKLNPN